MKIEYDKKFFKVLKQCSHIAEMIAIQNKGKKNVIFHKNSGMSFRLVTDKKFFDAGEHKIAFNDFKEFYDIIEVLKDEPDIYIDDTNIATIKSGSVEINYTLGSYDIIDMIETDVKLKEVQAVFKLPSETLAEIKKLSPLMGMSHESGRPRIDIQSKDGKVKLSFKNELSNDKLEYEFENISETPEDFAKSVNVGTLLDLPGSNYTVSLSTKNIMLIQMSADIKDYDLDFFAGFKG